MITSPSSRFSFIGAVTPILVFLCIGTVSVGNVRKTDGKPTSNVVFQYRKLIADGALLSPDGWHRASTLFSSSIPYPKNGPITLVYTGGPIAEDFVKGDRAQVESKWDEEYGTIDSKLNYSPSAIHSCVVVNVYTLVQMNGQWKLQEPLNRRLASLESALRYVEEAAKTTTDDSIQKNAQRTIRALKQLLAPHRNPASAC